MPLMFGIDSINIIENTQNLCNFFRNPGGHSPPLPSLLHLIRNPRRRDARPDKSRRGFLNWRSCAAGGQPDRELTCRYDAPTSFKIENYKRKGDEKREIKNYHQYTASCKASE